MLKPLYPQRISMLYGSKSVNIGLRKDATCLSHTEPPALVDTSSFAGGLLAQLRGLGKSFNNVGIVVSDKTRRCDYPKFLPVLTEVLGAYGLRNEDVIFYIAYGTHLRQTQEESLQSYGNTTLHYTFVHHESRDVNRLTTLGTTNRGTEVKVLKEILGHDLLITFGAVLHHYFAGFGGGRKMLFPGLAGYDSILQNHSLFLDLSKKKLHPGCQSGNLENNPLALDLEEINSMLPPRIDIMGILNGQQVLSEVHFGHHYNDFRNVCGRYDHFFRWKDPALFDMVVASAGGYPRDINFIQAHKAIHNAASFLKDGGTLIIFAACDEGIGNPFFMKLFDQGGSEALFEKLVTSYENNAGTALAMMEKIRRIKIHFVTSLDQETCRQMGAFKTSLKEVDQLIRKEKGRMAWTGNASLIYK